MSTPRPRAASEFQRNAFAPGILAAIFCIAGLPLVSADFYLVFRFVIAILAVIIAWFAWQARQWWWVPVMLVIAVVWNPLYPITLTGPLSPTAHIVAAVVFLTAGALIKVPRPVAR